MKEHKSNKHAAPWHRRKSEKPEKPSCSACPFSTRGLRGAKPGCRLTSRSPAAPDSPTICRRWRWPSSGKVIVGNCTAQQGKQEKDVC